MTTPRLIFDGKAFIWPFYKIMYYFERYLSEILQVAKFFCYAGILLF